VLSSRFPGNTNQWGEANQRHQIIITIAKSALFRRRLDETRGYLAYEDEAELAQQASLLVQKLCRELVCLRNIISYRSFEARILTTELSNRDTRFLLRALRSIPRYYYLQVMQRVPRKRPRL
jgi:hypothetical protein